MLKKTISYTDYNGVEQKEDFYFNLSKAEIMQMELSSQGGLENYITSLINTKDNAKIVEIFKSIIRKAYGIKSPDGRRFMKSDEISDSFEQSEAYSELFMELMDADKAADFIAAIIPNVPQDKKEEAIAKAKEMAKQ